METQVRDVITKGDRVRYLFQIQHGLKLIDETVSEWGRRLAVRVKANPLDGEAMYWLKLLEQLSRYIRMDELHDLVGKVVKEEIERNENRDELLERLFGEAQRRAGDARKEGTWRRTR
jgi:hypothetical protein